MKNIGKWVIFILAAWFLFYLGSAWFTGSMTLSSRFSNSVREITLNDNLGEFIGLTIFYLAMIGLFFILIMPSSTKKTEQKSSQNKDSDIEIEKIKKAYKKS